MILTDTQYGILDFIVENSDLGLAEDNCLDTIVSELSIPLKTARADILRLKELGFILAGSHTYSPTTKGITLIQKEDD